MHQLYASAFWRRRKEITRRGKNRKTIGHILSPLLEDKVNSGIRISKVDSGIGLPMVNVLESTLESAQGEVNYEKGSMHITMFNVTLLNTVSKCTERR
jgi:hypothetical protein